MAIERYIYIEKGWCVSVGGTTFRPAQMNGKVTTFQLIGLESFPPQKRKKSWHTQRWLAEKKRRHRQRLALLGFGKKKIKIKFCNLPANYLFKIKLKINFTTRTGLRVRVRVRVRSKKVRQSFRLSTFDFGFPFCEREERRGKEDCRAEVKWGLSTPFPLFLCFSLSLFLALKKAVIKYFAAYKMALLLENSISQQFLATAGFQQKATTWSRVWGNGGKWLGKAGRGKELLAWMNSKAVTVFGSSKI